jgi:hypothetical protein
MTPEAFVEHLRALRTNIPDYAQFPPKQANSIRRVAHLDADFSQAAINALGASDSVRAALGRNPEELQAESDTIRRWSAVEDEMRALYRGVVTANLVRRHRLGLTVLQTYSITQQLVRQPEHSDLLPHVEHMKRMNRFSRRRKEDTPQPQPAPPPATTPHV